MCLIKLQVQEQFLVFIIIEVIVIIFYKATCNTKFIFNITTIEFFDPFCIKMLLFLFIMIYYNIKEYQSRNKVIQHYNEKIAKIVYCHT